MPSKPTRAPQPLDSRASAVVLSAGFAATGIGVALPGVLLPLFLTQWHLGDARAGRLFLLAWAGSSAGALLVRGSLRRCLAAGCAALVLAALGLALGNCHAMELLLLLFGAGLGLVMTGISLLRQQATSTAPGGSGPELIRLNLLWAAGAAACPSLALHALAHGSASSLLLSLVLVFAMLGLFALRLPASLTAPEAPVFSLPHLLRRVPAPLAGMIFLVTGVEAAAGGWLTTYASRSGLTLGGMIGAPTALWAGLLLSRALWSIAGPRASRRAVVRGSLALATFAGASLLAAGFLARPAALLLFAAFLLGAALGPVYPLLLAAALDLHAGGAIFFVAGVGSAMLPWWTGIASQATGSLRAGMAIPTLALLLMLGLSVGWRDPPGTPIR